MSETADTQTCPACGLAVPDGDASFCPRCGAPLRGDTGPPAPPQGQAWATQPGAPAPAPAPTGAPTADDRNWGMLAHLSALAMFVGIPSFVGPLVVWLVKRDESPYVADHGREALNFNLSMLIYWVVSAVLVILLVGILLLIALGIVWLVLTISAGIKASRGETYRYPLTIRFVS